MSFGGRLETLDLSALLQTLSVGVASGRLTLTRLDRHAVLVLRGGRVVYVTGGAAVETLRLYSASSPLVDPSTTWTRV